VVFVGVLGALKPLHRTDPGFDKQGGGGCVHGRMPDAQLGRPSPGRVELRVWLAE